jgi:eukaryotic-like serine/threonine-protein kinase
MNADNMVGRTVAGYHLAEYIGEGGTATVYRAENSERGRAAVKILRPRLAQDPIAVKRFLREAEYGARVKHPNIVQTYDYGATDGLHYLALEWAPGEPLAEFINRSGKIAPPLVATIVEQLGAALGSAHKAGIIHRDLKPANIMYDPATQTAKLLDFGIARDAELNPEERLTRAGFFVGTLQYVAPETLSGELVSEQADVYSLATIAYYMLTQELPFTGKSPRELFQQLLTQPPVPLNQAVKGLRFPAPIEAAIMRGLERDLAKRSKTVDEFATELCTAIRQGGSKRGFLASLFGKGGESGTGE